MIERLIDSITSDWGHANILSQYRGRSGRERVLIFLRATYDRARTEPDALRLLYALFFEALGPVPELRARIVQFHRDQHAGLAQSVRRGLKDRSIVAGRSPDREADLIVAQVRGVAYQWCLDPEQNDHVRALAYVIEATEQRLAPPEEPAATSAGNRVSPAPRPTRRRKQAEA